MINAIRTSTINIDTIVPDSWQWVNASIQRLEVTEDGKISSVSPREQQLHRRIDKVASEVVTFKDPVTQKGVVLSIAGIGVAITTIMVKWMLEDNPGSRYDPVSGRVILDASD